MLVILGALERRNDILGAAAAYLGVCLGLDLLWLNSTGLGDIGLQGAAAELGESLSSHLTRPQVSRIGHAGFGCARLGLVSRRIPGRAYSARRACCFSNFPIRALTAPALLQLATACLVLLSCSLKLVTLSLCTLVLCTPRSDWLSSAGTALSSRHAALPRWLRMEGEDEDEVEEEEEGGAISSALSDGGVSFRSHFNPGAEHILVHATKKARRTHLRRVHEHGPLNASSSVRLWYVSCLRK